MNKPVSWNNVWQALPVLVLVITASLFITHYLYVSDLKTRAFEALVLKTQHLAMTQLKRHFDSIVTNLSIVGRWVQAESPALGNAAALNSRFMPILEEIPQIASMMVADSHGREYMLLRTGGGWLTRLSDAVPSGMQSLWNRWTGPNTSTESWQE